MKDIIGFEGLYAITSCGRVWSYRNQKFLKSSDNGKGYQKVNLHGADGKIKQMYLHRMVAEAYIPNPLGLPQVNHKDENKANNCINNLEWMTAKDNTNYGTGIQRQTNARKKPVLCIELNKEFDSATDAAIQLNLNKTHISKCCLGKQKTTGGYHWRFV